MGAIFFLVYNTSNYKNNYLSNVKLLDSFNNSKNRGSDYTDFIIENGTDIALRDPSNSFGLSKDQIYKYKLFRYIYGYHRKFINDSTYNGNQPFSYISDEVNGKNSRRYPPNTINRDTSNSVKLMCNGEIYNYMQLLYKFNIDSNSLQSSSDVEIILPLYNKLKKTIPHFNISNLIDELDGEFSFVLTDNIKDIQLTNIKGYVVRDIFGFKPMYSIINNKEEIYMFVSELKSIPEFINYDDNFEIKEFPIGSYYDFSDNKFYKYYNWEIYKDLEMCDEAKNTDPQSMGILYNKLYENIVNSVKVKLNNIPNNTNIGILLSGGFDSSLLLSIIIDNLSAFPTLTTNNLKIFTIGDLNEIGDAKYAIGLIKYLEEKYQIVLEHHIINISAEDLKSASDITELIYIIETYDLDTVRDAYPYYYLFKYINNYQSDISILFTGDGLDEICCGYSEFQHLPDDLYQLKNVEMIENISKYDILRTEKLACYFGLECRHPYINKSFVELYLSIHPKLKRNQVYMNKDNKSLYIEKYLLRKTIDIHNLLHESVLWRPIKWSSQCIDNFENELFNIYGKEEQQIYKDIFIKLFKKDTINKLWVDYWKI
jgi:asparagine synthase (glutamine-hydrolysing)